MQPSRRSQVQVQSQRVKLLVSFEGHLRACYVWRFIYMVKAVLGLVHNLSYSVFMLSISPTVRAQLFHIGTAYYSPLALNRRPRVAWMAAAAVERMGNQLRFVDITNAKVQLRTTPENS